MSEEQEPWSEQPPEEYPMPKDKCLQCNYPLTWADQRRQYGRVMKKGFTRDEARALLPRCQTCLTRALKARSP